MIFQSWMGLGISRWDITNGPTQGWVFFGPWSKWFILPKLDPIWSINIGIWMHVIEENKQMELNHDHLILKTK
jgi:hypothetical protein